MNLPLPADYQWPSFKPNLLLNKSESFVHRPDLILQIEDFFAKKYGCHALLFPSARSGLSALMLFLKINRSDVIFTSKWASKCVFDVIGSFSNPSVVMTEEVNKILLIHKWGKIYKSSRQHFSPECIIEDSVDSFIVDPKTLFANKGKYEVLSLPKLIGGNCGGIILTHDNGFKQFTKNLQGQNIELARWQSRLKNKEIDQNTEFLHPSDNELQNFSLIEKDLHALIKQLDIWENCQKIIIQRLESIKNKIPLNDLIHNPVQRVGPVLPLAVSKYNFKNIKGMMVRNFSFESEVSELKFVPCWLMPLHFGVDDKTFDQLLAGLEFLEK